MKSRPRRLRQVDVPEGESGKWKVVRFTVTEDDIALFNLRASIHGGGRFMRPGTYTQLTRSGGGMFGDQIVMSDTPSEIRDHWELMGHANKGRLLVNGLGLGVVVQAVLDEPAVEHLTVVEKSEDVIALVAAHWRNRYGGRLTVICADALDWTPPKGRKFQAVWHDIWDDITADNLPTMHRLHRKYGRRCEWQGSWCRRECERHRSLGFESGRRG